MKKAVSLLLALVLCIGLTPASLAVGETTITATDGLVYTLSHGILGTEQWTHNFNGYEQLDEDVTHTVYLVPEGTTVTVPEGYEFGSFFGFYPDDYIKVRGSAVTEIRTLFLPPRIDYLGVSTWLDVENEIRSEFVYFRHADGVVADAPSSWAFQSVNAAIAAGIVPDTLQVNYATATTRADFCHLAVALYESVTGKVITERSKFNDTTDVNVEKMAALGVVQGTGNNQFSPNSPLTREQAATMLSRLAAALGEELTEQAPTFSDSVTISSWAFDAVGQMQASGIMYGVANNAFAPTGEYTREQSITTMMRLYDLVK